MRPRNLRRRVAASAAVIVMMGVGAGYAAEADAQTATLTGTFGINPRWSSVVECPCEPVRYTPWMSQRAIAGGVDRLSQRVSRQGATVETVDHVAGFSLGAVVAVGMIWDHPDQAQRLTFTLIGSPDTPDGRPSKGKGHKGRNGLPDGDWSNVSFVVKEYDPVADPLKKWNLLAALNASMSVHLSYSGLDLTNPDRVFVDERTGARTLFFHSELPILRWVKPWLREDAYERVEERYRAKIDPAYEREWNQPQVQEQKTWVASSESPALSTETTPNTPVQETTTPKSSSRQRISVEPASPSRQEVTSTKGRTTVSANTSGPTRKAKSSDRTDRRESRRGGNRG